MWLTPASSSVASIASARSWRMPPRAAAPKITLVLRGRSVRRERRAAPIATVSKSIGDRTVSLVRARSAESATPDTGWTGLDDDLTDHAGTCVAVGHSTTTRPTGSDERHDPDLDRILDQPHARSVVNPRPVLGATWARCRRRTGAPAAGLHRGAARDRRRRRWIADRPGAGAASACTCSRRWRADHASLTPTAMHRCTTTLTRQVAAGAGGRRAPRAPPATGGRPRRAALADGRTVADVCGDAWPAIRWPRRTSAAAARRRGRHVRRDRDPPSRGHPRAMPNTTWWGTRGLDRARRLAWATTTARTAPLTSALRSPDTVSDDILLAAMLDR